MSKIVLKTPDMKRVVIDPSTDKKLYESPVNPPNTGRKYTCGKDLYAHTARSGKMYFYFHYWSMYESEEDSYEISDFETTKNFLIKKAGKVGWESLSETEIKTIEEEYGFGIYEEDA